MPRGRYDLPERPSLHSLFLTAFRVPDGQRSTKANPMSKASPTTGTPSASPKGQRKGLTRHGVIVAAVTNVMHETKTSLGGLALEFLTQYRASVPVMQRMLHLPDTGDVLRDAEAIRKTLERWLRGQSMHMPVEAEEPLVASLPEPYRSRLVTELAARYGLLPLRLSDLTGSTPDPTNLICALGDFLRHQTTNTPAAITALDELIASAVAMRHKLMMGGASER